MRDAQIAILEFGNTVNSVLIGVLDGLPKWFGDFSDVILQLRKNVVDNMKEMDNLAITTTNYGDRAKKTAEKVRGFKKDVDALVSSNEDLDNSNQKGTKEICRYTK